jgi:hypothetical protein
MRLVRVSLAFLAFVAALGACGSTSGRDFAHGGGDDGGALDGASPGTFGDTGTHCVGLQCQQVDCASQGKPATTVSGVVYDPAGKRPLYNAIVYVPNAPLDALSSGVSCDQCGAITSGNPIVTGLTGADGAFVLENAPAGKDIPLVVQIGKWRRQLTIPNVAACADTPMTDANVMRLPRNRAEGDMPLIAVATGFADPFECLLRKIGIDDAEFTSDKDAGRVHLYRGHDMAGTCVGCTQIPPAPSVAGSSRATDLWSDLARMKRYDVIVNACEGDTFPDEKPQASLQNFADYANAGGRIFNTHYHYYWIADGVSPMPTTATFPNDSAIGPDPIAAAIDTSFAKGDALAQWLVNVGASQTKGQLSIKQPRFDVSAVSALSLRWIYGTNTKTNEPAVFHYTFNTPYGAPDDQQCGKVLLSDFHLESISLAKLGANVFHYTFPAECDTNAMTAQELALEFMLFDLSSCIQKDTEPPKPPQTR